MHRSKTLDVTFAKTKQGKWVKMTLGEYIKILESKDPTKTVENGLGNPHSWRGSYRELAFEPIGTTTIDHMLGEARSALNNTYEGWKGGEFYMDEDTSINIDFEGNFSDGDTIWNMLLDFML